MKYLLITIDTEADWFKPLENNLSNIIELNYIQEMCTKFDYTPTYMVTYEVASRDESIKILKNFSDRNLCEIGSHLHVWTTPPFEQPNSNNVDIKWIHGLQSEINTETLNKKLYNLHNIIESNFGAAPTSHRAGRWALDHRTLNWLEQNKYKVDSSICAKKAWSFTKGIHKKVSYNSMEVNNLPYFPSKNDFTISSVSNENYNILEVPVTGIPSKYFSNSLKKPMLLFNLIMNRIGLYQFGNISFRPSYDIPVIEYEERIRKLFMGDYIFFNFMFHSNELSVGTSPYSKKIDMTFRLKNRIESVFKIANEFGVKGIRLSETSSILNTGTY